MGDMRSAVRNMIATVFGPDFTGWLGCRYWDFESALACRLSPDGRESRRRLVALKNSHRGERCFIIGNGPSLNKMDLTLLKDEVTFGLNRIYILFEKMGFSTTYLVAINKYLLEQSEKELDALDCKKFIGWTGRENVSFGPDTVFLRTRSGPRFCTDLPNEGVWESCTVTYVAMQLAYYMGFTEVVLIGVDNNFLTPGEPDSDVVADGNDPNHFDPNYFVKGEKWQIGDAVRIEKSYVLAKEAFEGDGRRILDATVDGKLTIFPKVDYKEIIGK
jgi:hypothetical protein